jgi:3'-5' exoribonuclease
MKEPMIADLARFENQVITGFFCASQKSVRSKKDGAAYFALTLADRTGQIEARMWEIADAGEFVQGDVVKIRGQVCRYNEKLQISVDRLRKAAEGEYSLADFVPSSERNIDELWAELNAWVASFEDADLQALMRAVLDDAAIAAALREAPAAKSMHHAWIGGLLEHVVSLVGICDLGKLEELRWGTSFEYTLPGQLLGHITIGVGMVEKKIAGLAGFPEAKRVLVQHMILSHHGKYEFGSPKLPMIPEAILLHYLDDMDAKMQTVKNEFARAVTNGRSGAEMTEWVRSMERPLLNTQAYLATLPATSELEAESKAEPESGKEAVANALPFED